MQEYYIFREAALIAAAQTPLFSDSSGRKDYGERERYPYVFDAHAEAKKSSAFIGGAKVLNFVLIEQKESVGGPL